jgi:1,4-dihydroxy-2-naphthoyl-CoA hydrolase
LHPKGAVYSTKIILITYFSNLNIFMSIFKNIATPESLNANAVGNMTNHIGIEFTEVGADYLCAKMPVDNRTKQPFGLLHGGASVVLAETLGSIAANLVVDNSKQYCVGLDINANHLKSVQGGFVYGKTTALHIGRSTQVWEIKITDEKNNLICISRLTVAVVTI